MAQLLKIKDMEKKEMIAKLESIWNDANNKYNHLVELYNKVDEDISIDDKDGRKRVLSQDVHYEAGRRDDAKEMYELIK